MQKQFHIRKNSSNVFIQLRPMSLVNPFFCFCTCWIYQTSRVKTPVVPKDFTLSFILDCGRLLLVSWWSFFPVTNLTNSSSFQNGKKNPNGYSKGNRFRVRVRSVWMYLIFTHPMTAHRFGAHAVHRSWKWSTWNGDLQFVAGCETKN